MTESPNVHRRYRNFGLVLSVALFALAVLRHGIHRWLSLSLAGIVLVLALRAPVLLAPVYSAWTASGRLLGWVNSRIILGLVYYLAVTPLGLMQKLAHRQVFQKRIDRAVKTYWEPDEQERTRQSLETMY